VGASAHHTSVVHQQSGPRNRASQVNNTEECAIQYYPEFCYSVGCIIDHGNIEGTHMAKQLLTLICETGPPKYDKINYD